MGGLRRAWSELERQAVLVVAASALLVCLLWRLPAELDDDGWLTLLGGRLVWGHGLPHADTLTVWSQGRDWVDQQWLAQLSFYGLERLGGVPLAMLVSLLLLVLALLLAAVLGQRLGGTPRASGPLAMLALAVLLVSAKLRAQDLALPLLPLTLYLLAQDARRPGRRVLWALPVLVLWANLHGSALLGSALVAGYGLERLVRRRGRDASAICLLLSPLCLLATPYTVAVVGYYRDVVFNHGFSGFVAEWQPSAPGPLTASFYLLAGLALALVARRPRPFSAWATLVLIAAGMLEERNMVWLALGALVLVAPALAKELESRGDDSMPWPLRLGLVLSMLPALAYLGLWAARPASAYERHYPSPVAIAVERAAAASPQRQIVADLRYADWLMWQEPDLEGRLAFDSRLELLSGQRFADLVDWYQAQGGYRRLARGQIAVVDETVTPRTFRALLAAQPQIVYAQGGLDVLVVR